MAVDLAALKTELLTDPNGYGYAPLIAQDNDSAVADLLNMIRSGISVRRQSIAPQDVLQCVDCRDVKANPAQFDCAWFESATRQTSIELLNTDGSDTQVLGNFKRLFQNPGTYGTRDRIIALCNRPGSRAEQLFGSGTTVTYQEVNAALAL